MLRFFTFQGPKIIWRNVLKLKIKLKDISCNHCLTRDTILRLLQIRSCWILICFACWTQFATFCFQQPFYFLFDCASKFSNRLSFYLISIARPRRLQMGRKMFQNVVWNCYLIRIAPSSISNYLGTIYIYASPTTNKTTNQGYIKKEYLLVALSLRRRKM